MLSLNKIVSKFVAKVLKYRLLFKPKDILTFLGLEYRDALLITLYLVVLEIIINKSDESDNFNIPNCYKNHHAKH